MDRKELLKVVKAASWQNVNEIEHFVQAAGQVTSLEISKILDMLLHNKLSSDVRAHRARCRAFASLAATCKDKTLFVPYLRALKNADGEVRRILISLLPTVNNVSEHPQLCAMLKLPEATMRQAAAQVLTKVGGKTALRIIGEMVLEKNFPGRMEAIDILATVAGHYAIGNFGDVLSVGKPQEKLRALQFLGDQRYVGKDPKGAAKAIARAFDDPGDNVVSKAIAAFCTHCDEESYFEEIEPFLDHSSINIACAAIEGLHHFPTPRVFSALERKLHAGPNPIRLSVLNVLEQVGSEDVLQPLVKALEHNQVQIRKRASEVLASLSRQGKIDLTRTIIWLLRSRNATVRRMAVETAAQVPDKDARLWPKLLSYLRDEDWWVRERVTDALVQMAGSELTAHIVAYLSDPSDVVRRFAVDVLIRLKDPKALGALVRTAQQDADWWVREKSLEAIRELGDPRSVPYIVDLLRREPALRVSCVETLLKMEAKETAADVASVIEDDDDDVRMMAVVCLDSFNDPSHANAVMKVAHDANLKVRRKARDLLTRWSINFASDGDSQDELSMLDRLLIAMNQVDGDDLILTPGRKPYLKKMGKTQPMANTVFTNEQLRTIIMPHLTVAQVDDLKALRDIDFSYEVRSEGLRFRANIFQANGGLGMVFRTIKGFVLELEKLGLPPVVRTFGELKNGLVLVGGPTGSGKSTTLAALIDYVNRNSARHIISLEDPIEVVHKRAKGLVNQRELGTHTQSFQSALRSTLREDPDVILVGELRDLETIGFAVTAAETGHLVFGTVHTVSADNSVDRLINAYPADEQEQVRSMLADSLRAVMCQYLIRRKDGKGRVLASEIMVNTDAVSNLIRKGKTFQISSVISTGREAGMRTMDNSLMSLYREGAISFDEAYMKAKNQADFDLLKEQEEQGDGNSAQVPQAATSGLTNIPTNPNAVAASAGSTARPPGMQPGISKPPGAAPAPAAGQPPVAGRPPLAQPQAAHPGQDPAAPTNKPRLAPSIAAKRAGRS